MKQFTLLALCAALYAFSSCSKERDARDQYVGKWKGETSVKFPEFPNYNSTLKSTERITKQANTTNKIVFLAGDSDFDSEAIVNGNSFTFPPSTVTKENDGQTITMTTEGKGTIKDTKMTASGTKSFELIGSGIRVDGTWTSTWTLQGLGHFFDNRIRSIESSILLMLKNGIEWLKNFGA